MLICEIDMPNLLGKGYGVDVDLDVLFRPIGPFDREGEPHAAAAVELN